MTKSILDKCLRVEISALARNVWEKRVVNTLDRKTIQTQWYFNKKGASHQYLLETLQKGQIE